MAVLQIETGTVTQRLQGHSESVEGASYSPDGRMAVTVSVDCSAIVWDLTSNHRPMRHRLAHPEVVTRAIWLGEGSPLVATSCMDGKVRVWDSRTGECANMLHGHRAAVIALDVQVAGAGHLIISGSDDEAVLIFQS